MLTNWLLHNCNKKEKRWIVEAGGQVAMETQTEGGYCVDSSFTPKLNRDLQTAPSVSAELIK